MAEFAIEIVFVTREGMREVRGRLGEVCQGRWRAKRDKRWGLPVPGRYRLAFDSPDDLLRAVRSAA
jgi:hypothetical protein